MAYPYNPPPPPPKSNIPIWVIAILGTCGGCLLICAVLVVMGVASLNKSVVGNEIRGTTSMAQKNYVQAEKEFRAAYKKNKNDPEILNNLAWALYKNGKSEEAIPLAEKAVQLSPSSHIIDTLGHAYLGVKRYDQAEKQFRRVLDTAPTEGSTLDGMGMLYEEKGDFKKAYDYYVKAKASGQDIDDIDTHLSRVKGQAGKSGDKKTGEESSEN